MLILQSRRGFTLAEMMLSLVLTIIATTAIYNLILVTQRLTRAQAQRMALQFNVRAGSLITVNELSELSTIVGGTPDQNDVVGMGPSGITYRAMRGLGLVCGAPAPSTLQIARNSFTGHRDPQAGRDEAYVFVAGNPATETEDSWVRVTVSSVVTSSPCPGGQGPGISVTFSSVPSSGLVEVGTPVRFAELMELRLYHADGRSWLGARSVSTGEPIQPLLGPLTDPGGFKLEYLDSTGGHSADRTDIKSIRVTLHGLAEGAGTANGVVVQEELISHITLRNTRRS